VKELGVLPARGRTFRSLGKVRHHGLAMVERHGGERERSERQARRERNGADHVQARGVVVGRLLGVHVIGELAREPPVRPSIGELAERGLHALRFRLRALPGAERLRDLDGFLEVLFGRACCRFLEDDRRPRRVTSAGEEIGELAESGEALARGALVGELDPEASAETLAVAESHGEAFAGDVFESVIVGRGHDPDSSAVDFPQRAGCCPPLG
jgi:hypothetical protein